MSRLLFSMGLFSFGFVLSIPVLLLGGFASINSLNVVAHDARAIGLSAMRASSGATESLISVENKLEILTGAVEEATLDSLQLIRKDQVEQYYDYRTVILPALKNESLMTLLKLFEPSDWMYWGEIRSGKREGTIASQYVLDLLAVNPEVGVFSDTAAHLLQGLKRTTEAGHYFDANQALSNIAVTKAEGAISLSTSPITEALDTGIVKDPVFVKELERERCWYTRMYLSSNPSEIRNIIALIRGIDVRFCDSELADNVSDFISYLSISGTPGIRKKVFYDSPMVSVLVQLAADNPRLKIVLAQFYVIGAIDSLNRNNPNQAMQFLSASREIYPALRSQADVEYRIDKLTGKTFSYDKALLTASLGPVETKVAKSPVGYFWLSSSFFGLSFLAFIFWRRTLARKRSLEAYNSDFIYEDVGEGLPADFEDSRPLAKVVNLRRHN